MCIPRFEPLPRGMVAALGLLLAASANAQCVGDCDHNGTVSINEIMTGVTIALGSQPVTACEAFNCQGSGAVPITCLIQGVDDALNGCVIPAPSTATATAPFTASATLISSATRSPVPTAATTATRSLAPTAHATTPPPTVGGSPTPTPKGDSLCPLGAGTYTLTQVDGGSLKLSTFQPFQFPAGGTLVLDVSAGHQPDCLHNVVVPFPGGFQTPAFCVPAGGASVRVVQTGCGIGQIHSNGGSDYSLTELGDTSDTYGPCNLPQLSCPAPGPAPDSSIRVNVAVGDGTPDTCSGGGTANAIVTIPVNTILWGSADTSCPDADGTYDPGTDTLLGQYPMILDLTTDTNSATFHDLDGDGCSRSGISPASGLSNTGRCMDLSKLNQNPTVKVCHTGTAACTTDADCIANGPCTVGKCQEDTRTGCDTDADCIAIRGGISFKTGPCQGPIAAPVVTLAASGTVGSAHGPLYDLTFTTALPNWLTGPAAPLGATCDSPPLIDFHGTVDRCIR